MKKLLKIFYKYGTLIIVAFLFEIISSTITIFSLYNFLENIFFASALICLIYIFQSNKLKTIYFYISFVFFSICLFLETAYYYLFDTYFSSSAIFVTLDSNAEESKEFLNFYIDTPIIVFTLIFGLLVLYLLLKSRNIFENNFVQSKYSKLKILLLFFGIVLFIRQSTLIRFNLPYLILKSGIEYRAESEKLGDYKNNKTGNFNDVSRLSGTNEDEVYVVIIGESTARSHMGIYDYYRETTPKLSSIKNQLAIYNDVISPHVYSVGALTKILTLANYENPERISEGSIIQLINAVGFDTYWLSNQRPIGPFESMITKISLSSKESKFLTTTVAGNSKVLDGELLVEFNKALRYKKQKKVIFLHMMGTHHHYENRYPESFSKFNDEPRTNFKSEESFAKINHYDNTILYNDFIISEVIRKVDSLNKKSFVLYFSDHAEEMYSELDMAGHNEDIYSKQMFDIPFFLWQSQKYKEEKALLFESNRKYMIDDLFHSIADLLHISAKEVETSRSIFSEDFKDRKRIIKDTINYDTFFAP